MSGLPGSRALADVIRAAIKLEAIDDRALEEELMCALHLFAAAVEARGSITAERATATRALVIDCGAVFVALANVLDAQIAELAA